MIYTKKGLIILARDIFFITAIIYSLVGCNKGDKEIPSKKNIKGNIETGRTQQPKAMPHLIIREGNHLNIGTVKEGTQPHVSFTLVNIGNAEANISLDDLSKSGCTAVSMIPKLAAGDSSRLEFIFETLGYGGRTDTRRVRINYNNPALSPLEISVSAKILPTKSYQAPIGELWYGFYVLVDVRSPKAFAKQHLVGSINVPFKKLNSWASRLPKYILIYLISENGTKSDQAAKMMRKNGFSECVSLIGGINEWKKRYNKKKLIISGSW